MARISYERGHGKYTAGKRSPAGEREWYFNNTVVNAMVERLRQYENVELLDCADPSGETDTPLSTRTNRANAWGSDLHISVHHNANKGFWSSEWTGCETYIYTTASAASERLAREVHPRLVKAMGLKDRGIRRKNLHITRETRMPAILTEGGYMDSLIDIKAMRDKDKMKAQGYAIADGAAAFLGLKMKPAALAAAGSFAEEGENDMSNHLFIPPDSLKTAVSVVLLRMADSEVHEDRALSSHWRDRFLKGEMTKDEAIGILYHGFYKGLFG